MKRSLWIALLKYGLGIGLLVWVIASNWRSDDPSTPGLAELLQNPLQVWPLLAAFILCAAGVSITFIRWYILVRAQHLPFTLHNAFRLGLIGYYLNTFLPGSVGGDLLKAYFIAKEQPGKRAVAVATVMADRLIGLWGLIWWVALLGVYLQLTGYPALTSNLELRWIIQTAWWVIAGSLVAWLLLGLMPRSRADRFAGRLRWIPKLGNPLAEIWLTIWLYRQRPGIVLMTLALSMLSHSCFVFTFHFAVRVFTGAEASGGLGSLPEHFVIVPVAMIVQALFPTPGGVGGGEKAFEWLYGTVLAKPQVNGVVGMLTVRVITWVLGFIGYLVYLRMKSRLPEIPPDAQVPTELPPINDSDESAPRLPGEGLS